MSLNFARQIKNYCYIASSLLAAASFLFQSQRILCLILAVVVLIAGIVVSVTFYRCPSCKKPLPTNGALPKECPHCREQLR